MTITGINSTSQPADGDVFTSRRETDDQALRAEWDALGADLMPAAGASSQTTPKTVSEQDFEPIARRRWWPRLTRLDVLAIVSILVVALYLTAPLWLNPDHQLRDDPADQDFFEWMLANGARLLTHGGNPFFTTRLNYPDGVNMMANTSVLAVSLPLTPVTLLFGPQVAFEAFLTFALTLTGASWYLVLSRRIVGSRLPAWVGAIFAAFAPGMVSQADGHPNIACQFLVPLIIWRTLELRRRGRARRNGPVLAALVIVQSFVNLEVLFMTASGLGLFCVVMAVVRRRRGEAAAFVRGLLVAAGLTLAVLAYPLSVQFFGPQSYQGLAMFVRNYGTDLAAFTAYSSHSVAGAGGAADLLAQNAAEQNAFLGWGVVILFFGLVVWLRRRVEVLVLGALAVLFGALSLGPIIFVNGVNSGYTGIWSAMRGVPVLNSAVPTRWSLAIIPVAAIVLALGCRRAADLVKAQPAARGPVRVAMVAAVAMALVPIAPVPLPAAPMNPVPKFVTSGAWKTYAGDGHTVVSLPLPDSTYPDPLRWSATTGLDMRIAGAYALLPQENPLAPDDHTATFSPPWRPTSGLATSIVEGNPIPEITDTRRELTLADLRYWHAGVIVLAPQTRDSDLLLAMDEILGFQPTWTGGVWVWDVRALVDDPKATLTGPDIS